jgi:hypothetical protein
MPSATTNRRRAGAASFVRRIIPVCVAAANSTPEGTTAP